jgi:hypothetical protein
MPSRRARSAVDSLGSRDGSSDPFALNARINQCTGSAPLLRPQGGAPRRGRVAWPHSPIRISDLTVRAMPVCVVHDRSARRDRLWSAGGPARVKGGVGIPGLDHNSGLSGRNSATVDTASASSALFRSRCDSGLRGAERRSAMGHRSQRRTPLGQVESGSTMRFVVEEDNGRSLRWRLLAGDGSPPATSEDGFAGADSAGRSACDAVRAVAIG